MRIFFHFRRRFASRAWPVPLGDPPWFLSLARAPLLGGCPSNPGCLFWVRQPLSVSLKVLITSGARHHFIGLVQPIRDRSDHSSFSY